MIGFFIPVTSQGGKTELVTKGGGEIEEVGVLTDKNLRITGLIVGFNMSLILE